VAWTPSGVPADPSAYANPDGGIVFSAPSGNLHCGYSEWGGLWWWCLADELSVSLPPDPAGRCVGEYVGGAAIVPNGIGVIGADPDARPESFCAGSDESPVLPYGSSISYRDMGCESSDEGMTCRSLLTGAGFRLSRSDYELF
jgi:hypothetical protein